MLEGWTSDSVTADAIQLSDDRVQAALSKKDQSVWRRLRKLLGSEIIDISVVRRVLKPADQDRLYHIVQTVMEHETDQ